MMVLKTGTLLSLATSIEFCLLSGSTKSVFIRSPVCSKESVQTIDFYRFTKLPISPELGSQPQVVSGILAAVLSTLHQGVPSVPPERTRETPSSYQRL